MKKYGKVLALVMVMTMLLVPTLGVSAAGSSTADVTVSGDSKDKYDISDADDAFKDFETSDKELYDNLVGYNKGEVKLEDVIEEASDDVKKELEGKKPVTKFYELVDATTNPSTGKQTVTLTVPALTDQLEDVVVLHYDNGTWKVVKATVNGQTLTVELDSLGVFGIFASLKTAGEGGVGGGSAATGGTNSTWMVALAVVLVAVGAVVVVSQKRRAK